MVMISGYTWNVYNFNISMCSDNLKFEQDTNY